MPTPQVEVLESFEIQRLTYYEAVPEQTDSTPGIAACGPNIGNQLAVSRDLFRDELQCGDVVEVFAWGSSLGEYVVWDTMARRWRRTADILVVDDPPIGLASGHLVLKEDRSETD